MTKTGPKLFWVLAVCFVGRASSEYLGKFLGKLSELHHGVSGEVYAVDGRTLYIKDFTYDGQGPAAYFYASTYKTADSRGFRLRDENNNGDVIRRYRKEGVTLTLPEGKTLNNIKIFYVWCEEFDVNFGDVKIPRNFDNPRPQKIDALKGVHSISSDNIVIVDAQTLLIPNLHYDGEAPDAKFWVGRGPKPSPQGIRVPDENGKEVPLRKYDGKTVVLTLPGDLTVFDIGHFGIWCEQFTVDFGHIQIPQGLNVPPSLKMLGVSPQSKLNCEVLHDDLAFEVRWAVAGESIVLQLVAKLDNKEYMSFGLSGDDSKSVMIGGDVVVAWVDKDTLKGYAEDYYLADKSQCSGPSGSCPDTTFGADSDNIRLLNAAMVNGYSIVTYQRPLNTNDQFDLPIYTNRSQAIIWAIGPLNQRNQVSFHTSYLKDNTLIDFGRPAKWNCPVPEGDTPGRQSTAIQNRQQEHVTDEVTQSSDQYQPEELAEPSSTAAPRREGGNRRRGSTRRQPAATTEIAEEGQASRKEPTRTKGSNRITQRGTQTVPPPTPVKERNPWHIPPIECYEPEDGVFYAQMGPTGGKRGYPAITGHVGWGISWYINGLLIPEINVVRGKTYNFITEGGDNPDVPAKYHPFYITDDAVGGYAYKTDEEKKNVTIYSGVRFDKNGEAHPTGTGRLCHWTQTGDNEADDFESFGAYQRTLQLKCDVGEPGVIQWTPDKNTPDTVYYQCFTHRHLGWKINVHDTCEQGAASEIKPSYIEAPRNSLRQETRVMQNNILAEEIKADNFSQPTISEYSTSLDQPTPTSQQNSDQFPNTSPLFQSPQGYFVDPHNQFSGFSRTSHHKVGQFMNYHTGALNFRASLPNDITKEYFVANTNVAPKLVKAIPQKRGPQLIKQQSHVKNHYTSIPLSYMRQTSYQQPKLNPALKTPHTNPSLFFNTLPMSALIPMSIPVNNVEVSPEQASTEKEPEIQTASSLLSVHPSSDENFKFQAANNNGFNPQSIVIEGGFKPIINREIENRIDTIAPEIDPMGENGVIDIEGETPDDLKPIFVDKKFTKKPSENDINQVIVRKRSLPEKAAAKRVESYYLPPPGHSAKPKLGAAKLPSELDFEADNGPSLRSSGGSPPDVVVAFDGKRVSGASLVAKPFEMSTSLQQGSKTAQFQKTHPQSVPFGGDLPPLSSGVLFNPKMLGHSSRSGVLSRDLDTPLLPSSETTKLKRIVSGS